MPWPRKISIFGKGSGRLHSMPSPPPVQPPMPPSGILQALEGAKKSRKREFMHQAIIAMLGNYENMPTFRKGSDEFARWASEIYDTIEEQLKE